MKKITNKINQLQKITVNIFCVALLTVFAVVAANAQKEKSADLDLRGFDLTGTWEVTITPDDGSPSFIGYYSFGAEGNVSFSSAGPPIPALGNPGYGAWKRTRTNRFAATIKMNSYTENFQFDGTLKINIKILMTSPNTFITQNDVVIVYDAAGNEIVRLGGSAAGRRIVVED